MIVPPVLLVMVVVELSVSPLAMVIAAELVMPLLAVMLPPVTAIVAPLLLVTAPVNVPEPVIFELASSIGDPAGARRSECRLRC